MGASGGGGVQEIKTRGEEERGCTFLLLRGVGPTMVDVASLAIAVRLATIDERFKCSVCELLLPRTQFTPFHRVVNEQRRLVHGPSHRAMYTSTNSSPSCTSHHRLRSAFASFSLC